MPELVRASRGPARLGPSLGATDAGGLEFAIACLPDLGVPADQAIVRGHVPDRAVQPPGVVLLHEGADHPPRVLQVQRCLRAHRLGFQRAVPALDLPVRLRIVRRRADVVHATQADEVLEVPGDELRAVVTDQPGRRPGYFSLAFCNTSSTSGSVIDSRISQCRFARLHPSSTLHR